MQLVALMGKILKQMQTNGCVVKTGFEQELQLTDRDTNREVSHAQYEDFCEAVYEIIPDLRPSKKTFKKEVNGVIEFSCPPCSPYETAAYYNLLVLTLRQVAEQKRYIPAWHRSDISISICDEHGVDILAHANSDERAGPICGLMAKAIDDGMPIFIRRNRYERIGTRSIDAGMTRIRAMRMVYGKKHIETRLDHNPLQGQHMAASLAIILGAAYLALSDPASVPYYLDGMQQPKFHKNLYWFDDGYGHDSPCFFFKEILRGSRIYLDRKWDFDLEQLANYNKPAFLQREMGYESDGRLSDFLRSLRLAQDRKSLLWSEEAASTFQKTFIDGLRNIIVYPDTKRFFAYRVVEQRPARSHQKVMSRMAQSKVLPVILGECIFQDMLQEFGFISNQAPPFAPQ